MVGQILVWDWPVRIGHWLLAAAFVVAWLTGESEEWRLVHALAGGVVVGVVLFRLAWGLVGTRYARFSAFVRGPGAVKDYLTGLLAHRPAADPGHNPAGGWAILGLLALGLVAGVSGWVTYQGGPSAEAFEELHEGLANAMLALVLVHLAGVAVGSLAHGENLPRSMVTGLKRGTAAQAIATARPAAVLALLGWAAACAWWLAR